jgi:hypothetical protein
VALAGFLLGSCDLLFPYNPGGRDAALANESLTDGTRTPIEIDRFTEGFSINRDCSSPPSTPCTLGSWSGGVREAVIEPPQVLCGHGYAYTSQGRLCLKSSQQNLNASVRVWWDGVCDGALTLAGQLGMGLSGSHLELTLAHLDHADTVSVELAVDVYSGASGWSRFSTTNARFGLTAAEQSLASPRTTQVRLDEFVPQAGGGADYSNVGAIRLSITALVWGVDACVGPLRWVFDGPPAG